MNERRHHISKCAVEFDLSGSRYDCNGRYFQQHHEEKLTAIRKFIESQGGVLTLVGFAFFDADREI